MTKGQPFSVRLDEATEQLVEAEARRTRRSKSAVVEALTEEAARARRFAGIAYRGDDAGRRAWVIGSGLDVWEIAQMVDESGSPGTLERDSELSAGQIRLAMAYRAAYAAEIDGLIEENRRPLTDVEALFPFIEVAGA